MIKPVAFAAALAAACLSLPAAAPAATVVPAVFNFTTGSNSGVLDGNVRTFTATSPDLGTYKVKVSGWSMKTVSGVTTVYDSKLMVYSGGLGVISGDDGTGGSGQHTVDNNNRVDFLLLHFDRSVEFERATFNTYEVLGGTRDSDAVLKYGDTSQLWGEKFALDGKNVSHLNALFSGGFLSTGPAGVHSTRNINPHDFAGNLWMVAAAYPNPDRKTDGFKFTNLAVIPEPETWAMMIGGFALVGAAARRRGRTAARLTA